MAAVDWDKANRASTLLKVIDDLLTIPGKGCSTEIKSLKIKLQNMFKDIEVSTRTACKKLGYVKYYPFGLCEVSIGWQKYQVELDPYDYTPPKRKATDPNKPKKHNVSIEFLANRNAILYFCIKAKEGKKIDKATEDTRYRLIDIMDRVTRYRELPENQKEDFMTAYMLTANSDSVRAYQSALNYKKYLENREKDKTFIYNYKPNNYEEIIAWTPEEVLYRKELETLMDRIIQYNCDYYSTKDYIYYLDIPTQSTLDLCHTIFQQSKETGLKFRDMYNNCKIAHTGIDIVVTQTNSGRRYVPELKEIYKMNPFEFHDFISSKVTDVNIRKTLVALGILNSVEIDQPEESHDNIIEFTGSYIISDVEGA